MDEDEVTLVEQALKSGHRVFLCELGEAPLEVTSVQRGYEDPALGPETIPEDVFWLKNGKYAGALAVSLDEFQIVTFTPMGGAPDPEDELHRVGWRIEQQLLDLQFNPRPKEPREFVGALTNLETLRAQEWALTKRVRHQQLEEAVRQALERVKPSGGT